jgi:glycosyltransferase involved in cell wall biosynthesis
MQSKQRILFFLSHQPNPRFVKQLNYLAARNEVSLYYFHRASLANLNDSLHKTIHVFHIDSLTNASQPFKRIYTYFKSLRTLKKRFQNNHYDTIIVNNIDVLLMLRLTMKKQTLKKVSIAIEISDLRNFVFSSSMKSKSLRKLEKYLYKKYVDQLIVTSKKYYTEHFQKFFKKDYFLLENKLLKDSINLDKAPKEPSQNTKFTIGIVGLLLRGDEYVRLFELYKDHQEIEIVIHGLGIYQHIVEEYAAKHGNITYFGPYNTFEDSANIYNSLGAIYIVYDTDQVSLNNRLALPNKLYESMYYQVPIICSKNTYLSEIVKEYNIGVAVNYKNDKEMKEAIDYIATNREYIKENFNKIPEDRYFGDNDYKMLEEFLNTPK